MAPQNGRTSHIHELPDIGLSRGRQIHQRALEGDTRNHHEQTLCGRPEPAGALRLYANVRWVWLYNVVFGWSRVTDARLITIGGGTSEVMKEILVKLEGL